MRRIVVVLVIAACGGSKATPDASAPASDADVQPPTTCDDPVPLVDVSHPTSVVRPCTEAALRIAVGRGGVILFDCGGAATTIPISAPIDVTTDTTLDGGGRVTLDGGHLTRILHLASASNLTTPTLTVHRRSRAARSAA